MKKINVVYYIFFLLFIIMSAAFIFLFSKSTFEWIAQGLSEIFGLFIGNKDGYFETLFNDYLFFPNGLKEILFGTGINLFSSTWIRSDVGYVIDIWYLGIIGTIIKYGAIIYVLVKLIKEDNYFIFVITVLIISNVKGIIFENNEVIVFITLLILNNSYKFEKKIVNDTIIKGEKLSLSEIQKIQINILETIKPILDSLNIKYSLAYGTLIGAVRHKGYIPWDYDIDICLPRSDYNKLLAETRNKNYNGIEIVSNESDKKYCIEFARAIDTSTIDEIGINSYFRKIGLFIDIYPIDYAPDSMDTYFKERKQVISIIKLLRLISFYSEDEDVSWYKKIIKKVIFCLGRDYISYLIKLINYIEVEFSNKSSKKSMGFIQDEDAEKAIFDAQLFNELIDIEFENDYYRSFKNYDKYLSKIYGNYMELPPIEDQVTRYEVNAYKKGEE